MGATAKLMQVPATCALVAFLLSCAGIRTVEPLAAFPLRPGQVLAGAEGLPKRKDLLCVSSRGRTISACVVEFRGIDFMVDIPGDLAEVAPGGESRISRVSTCDQRFSTPEGARVGTPIAVVLEIRGVIPLRESCDLVLPSGWRARCDGATPPKIACFDSGD